jgi:hypothetical protein
MRRRAALLLLPLCALGAGCGDDADAPDPQTEVRRAVVEYVAALRERRWEDACARMTAGARAAVADPPATCPDALRGGAALPDDVLGTVARQLPGAAVAVSGARATLGPVGDLPQPLRLVRRGRSWLIDG